MGLALYHKNKKDDTNVGNEKAQSENKQREDQ
jgi:hypothetical protein